MKVVRNEESDGKSPSSLDCKRRSKSAAGGGPIVRHLRGSKLILGLGVKLDNPRVLGWELKRAGGRAASLQLAPPGGRMDLASGLGVRSV
jgi:hypothetical protein